MSTDPQHKSMFILLSIISVLVISTLVVASIYFLKPSIESTPNTPVKAQVPSLTNNAFEQGNRDSLKNQKASTAKITTTQTGSRIKKQISQDGCNIHFSENQLLVKNSDRKK